MLKVLTIQKIWRIKTNTCKQAIRPKKKNHSSTINPATQKHLSMAQQGELLSMESVSPSMSTILQTRLANIDQRAQRLMKFSSTIQDNGLF